MTATTVEILIIIAGIWLIGAVAAVVLARNP
jgi:hypothetical protein